ncbi:Gfo/Idh/MocA family oxidoreductase [soil metagenome]
MNSSVVAVQQTTPRLGFLGVGRIGTRRMVTLAASGAGRIAAIADSVVERAVQARAVAPDAHVADSLDALLELDLDGIVIATPPALHAEQCMRALGHGVAVFCQKPLARTAAETRAVVAAARAANRLLGIDLSYRFTAAMQSVRNAVRSGDIGTVYAANLVFHNAWGPDRGWARDPALAGGGCVLDLGVHLVDLAFWVLDFPAVKRVDSQLFAGGNRLQRDGRDGRGEVVCEDFATATIELATGATVRMACSWELHAGRDAIIEATFHGRDGGAVMRNVDGSFFDFTAELHRGASAGVLCSPPDDWGGRALIDWSSRLADGARYDVGVETAVVVAETLDAVLGR